MKEDDVLNNLIKKLRYVLSIWSTNQFQNNLEEKVFYSTLI
jgi:hypothetical protein